MARQLSLFYTLLLLFRLSVADTVTIKSAFDSDTHSCISKCLYYVIYTDLGDAMGCDTPYDNACYCATASASASVADSWMSRCASSSCGRGDYTRDLSAMQSIYGSYCMGAGFTQPGATDWYSPATTTEEASSETGGSDSSNSNSNSDSNSDSNDSNSDAEPSKTVNSGAAATTTEVTVITQTAEGGSVTVQTQVIVHATSTLLVNSAGSPASIGINDSSDNNAVKIGVGVAVPVVAILVGAFGWWFWRRRRNAQGTQPSVEAGTSDTPTSPPMGAAAVTRKPVGSSIVSPVSDTVSPVTSKTTELSGECVKSEMDGRRARPFVTPSSPIQFPGSHEVSGDTTLRPEMDGLGQNPYVEVSGVARPPELPGHVQTPPPGYGQHEQQPQRWELPDNSRR